MRPTGMRPTGMRRAMRNRGMRPGRFLTAAGNARFHAGRNPLAEM